MQRKNHFSYLVSRISYCVYRIVFNAVILAKAGIYNLSIIIYPLFYCFATKFSPLLAFACPVEKIRRRLFFSPTRLILRRKIAQNSQKFLANRIPFPLELYLGETLLGGFQNEDCDLCPPLPALGHFLPGGGNHHR